MGAAYSYQNQPHQAREVQVSPRTKCSYCKEKILDGELIIYKPIYKTKSTILHARCSCLDWWEGWSGEHQ